MIEISPETAAAAEVAATRRTTSSAIKIRSKAILNGV